MKAQRARTRKKLKPLGILFLVITLAGGLFSTIVYYGFEPALLTKLSFYVNLANPYVRIVRVPEGLRKEQIANIMAEKLEWTPEEKANFLNAHLALNTTDPEGRYFPKTYLINKDEDPVAVSATMFKEFSEQTEKIKNKKSKELMNESTALKIASLIQRESNGTKDMHLISGIIWNRIWSGMRLQIDATLQYAKGSEEEGWWQQVDPEDKKIKSSYNTYMHNGLPPAPIANPGLAAIEAAYNPAKTDCLFYLHDRNKQIHCARTYEQHKENIKRYY